MLNKLNGSIGLRWLDSGGGGTYNKLRIWWCLMRINVAGLLKSPVGSVRTYNIDSTVEMDSQGSCSVQGAVKLVRIKRGVLVSAQFHSQIPSVCSRCLTPFASPVSASLEEEFLSLSEAQREGGLLLTDAEPGFVIDADQVLDLSEAFRQYMVLAMPLKPLCRPDCAGLCVQCGRNLNQGSCVHRSSTVGS